MTTARDLTKVEAAYQAASRRAETAREQRNAAIRQALADGWTHAQIADTMGHPRGWVSQQAKSIERTTA